MLSINDEIITLTKNWSCCSLATVNLDNLPGKEKNYFDSFMPEVVTVIALLHHVVTEEEWLWYSDMDCLKQCDADNHLRDRCNIIRELLVLKGYPTKLVPYPGISGLQFRIIAQATGLGEIGTNGFLFHHAWGPWVHLRVMATTAKLNIRDELSGAELCDQCHICISECPAGAITEENFDGLRCQTFRYTRGEYKSYGPKGLLRFCKKCILACPKGTQPVLLKSVDK